MWRVHSLESDGMRQVLEVGNGVTRDKWLSILEIQTHFKCGNVYGPKMGKTQERKGELNMTLRGSTLV